MDKPALLSKSPPGAIRYYKSLQILVEKAQEGSPVVLFKVKVSGSTPRMQKHRLGETTSITPQEIRCKGHTMLQLYNVKGISPTRFAEKFSKNYLFTNYFLAYGYLQRLIKETQHA